MSTASASPSQTGPQTNGLSPPPSLTTPRYATLGRVSRRSLTVGTRPDTLARRPLSVPRRRLVSRLVCPPSPTGRAGFAGGFPTSERREANLGAVWNLC